MMRTVYAVDIWYTLAPGVDRNTRQPKQFGDTAEARHWAEQEWPSYDFDVVKVPHEQVVYSTRNGDDDG